LRKIRNYCAAVAVGVAIASSFAACGDDEGSDGTAASAPAVEVDADTVVVDVRTPAEFAEGHLDGAVNIDVSAPGFATVIADLPVAGSYVVYCRSGNRSAQAVAQMEQLGFTDVFDAGGLDQAATSTGLDITTTP
jgi:rhodanese-related sulfurtransferase